eukprot:GHVU01225843.1.p1 GENE.GHVU01225843.1~~GHVU01225843.1.p1  ORF type:complete len:288 (+),score=29.76 GHVU01225843.1:2169-3032(+)
MILEQSDPRATNNRDRVIRNPGICVAFFDQVLSIMMKTVLKETLKMKDYWFKYEYQHRGSIHAHGLVWSDLPFTFPPKDDGLNPARIAEIERVSSCWNPAAPGISENDAPGKEWLPTELRTETKIAPSSQEVPDDVKKEDLVALANLLQRHTKCSSNTCLRKDKKTGQIVCRGNFPKDLCEAARFFFDVEKKKFVFQRARNDPYVNNFNDTILTTMRSNMDIQPILSDREVKSYVTKYVNKQELSSTEFLSIIKQMQRHKDDGEPTASWHGLCKVVDHFIGSRLHRF